MSSTKALTGRGRRVLPTLVLALILPVFLLASVARAEDPPIVSIGSGGQADVCVNDQGATVDTSDPSAKGGSCSQSGSTGSSGSGGSSGSTGATGSKAGSGSRAGSATWVSSSGALGLKIVRVQPQTKLAGFTKRFAVVVTVRDLRGKTIRHAIVSVGRVQYARNTIAGRYSAFSNKAGKAKVSVPAASSMLGKRLLLKIVARTPRASATTLRTVRLPKAG